MVTRGPKYLFTLSYLAIIVAMLGYFVIYLTGINNPMWMLVIVSIIYQLGRGILEFISLECFPFYTRC